MNVRRLTSASSTASSFAMKIAVSSIIMWTTACSAFQTEHTSTSWPRSSDFLVTRRWEVPQYFAFVDEKVMVSPRQLVGTTSTQLHAVSTKEEIKTETPQETTTVQDENVALADEKDAAKFGFGQRIESIKCLVVGALSGSIALVPFSFAHNVLLPLPYNTNGLAQWEFETDMAGIEAGLFAIVYRYCIREDKNDQLNQGVVGAFVLTRTLSRIVVPKYCTAIALDCGPPLGYLDWAMIFQLVENYVESAALFGATAAAIDWCMKKEVISKFPG